ncbi:hypothetical protein HQ487_04780 [Candidatus Uhrbacteria bacterium]|nr:hypothetical protein [Candidatus Uhrbacteria bacterium]
MRSERTPDSFQFHENSKVDTRRPFEMPEFRVPEIPPMTTVEHGEKDRVERLSVSFEFEGQSYNAEISVRRFKDQNFEISSGGPEGGIDIEMFKNVGKTKELMSKFKAALNNRVEYDNHAPADGKRHRYWRIYTRLILDQSMRGRGFGKVNLAMMERAMEQAEKAMGKTSEWIEIRTKLGALANMIVDSQWLAEALTRPGTSGSEKDREKLEVRAFSEGMFHYQPVPVQEKKAIALLQKRSQALEDADDRTEEIVFIRMFGERQVSDVFK